MTGRSPDAKRRRAPARSRAIASGTRVACARCECLHPAPACDPWAEPQVVAVALPPWLHMRLVERVESGKRSAWVAGLIRRELEQ